MRDNTQKKTILKALQRGEELSSMWGFQNGIVRLTNRINELRNNGIAISDRWVEAVNKNGVKVKFKMYYLKK